MRVAQFIPLCLIFAASCFGAGAPTVVFDRQIRPILSDNCFTCHGPDDKHRMAGLHFDTKDGAFSKAGVIVPGDSANSKMYLRISNQNEAMRMPPTYSGHKLTPAQIELIKTWIDQGAKWETHWAFVTLRQPAAPAVSDPKWVKTPLDSFVLAKLDKEGLKPSPEADKATLLRRVTFDLTGLPPTPPELKAYLADYSTNAYEKVVDRLLASPHYGERMAMQWMDFARYSDTHGYHIDSARQMWVWRDWVIQAFTKNMPYDQFTIEQIAGDLLPNATQSQKIATGFNRNHMINFEGGAIPEEYENEYMVDRIEATSTTWLGVTLGCARCHDHKYDPLRQKDFYSFGAFFNTISDKGLDGYKGNAAPYLQLPSLAQADMKALLSAAIKQKDFEIAAAQTEWEKTQANMATAPMAAPAAKINFEGAKLPFVDGRLGKAADFGDEAQFSLGAIPGFPSASAFTVSMWVKPEGPSGMSILQAFKTSPQSGPGFEIAADYCNKENCNVIVRMQSDGTKTGFEAKSLQGLNLSDWNQLTVSYDGSGHAKGVQIYVNGASVNTTTMRDTFAGASFDGVGWVIGKKEWGVPFKGQLQDIRFYSKRMYASEAFKLGVTEPLEAVLAIPADKRNEDQKKWVSEYFLAQVGNPAERQLGADRSTLKRGLSQLDTEITSTMVMAESDKPRETFVLSRGDYRNKTEKVEPNTPAVLPPLPRDAPRNRLTLARWLVDPANPLTARVAVNHFWQMYFGLGIVKTSEDFGSQGDPPSNQDLLDWLATEFVRTKWDVKAMQRLIVTSAVYRQASKVSPELLERDPENRLLARGPRFRLPAEMVRDNALAVSGLINQQIGGASVLPYQPKGLWEEMAFGGDFSAQTYVQSHGADLYRRSMYTFVKRTVPYPGLNTFDAPDREKCTARRGITNTPLQALVLMNDPTYVEAARALAQRDLDEAKPTEGDRIRYAFRLATDRDPSVKEAEILHNLYRKEINHYDTNRAAAQKLLTVGESKAKAQYDPAELAAWTLVASTILNMDETVTKN